MAHHLICFGDSLTAGFQSAGWGTGPCRDTPYGGFLQSWLGSQGKVTISGVCGELTKEMTERFARDVVRHAPDRVVILGGTNDLGYGLSPGSIIEYLRDLYRQAQDAGVQPVGVTVPSIGAGLGDSMTSDASSEAISHDIPEWARSHIEARRRLNHMIQETCASMRMGCVDLFAGTSEPPYSLLAPVFSNDGLHLSTQGYKRFAELVWQVLFQEQFGMPPEEGLAV